MMTLQQSKNRIALKIISLIMAQVFFAVNLGYTASNLRPVMRTQGEEFKKEFDNNYKRESTKFFVSHFSLCPKQNRFTKEGDPTDEWFSIDGERYNVKKDMEKINNLPELVSIEPPGSSVTFSIRGPSDRKKRLRLIRYLTKSPEIFIDALNRSEGFRKGEISQNIILIAADKYDYTGGFCGDDNIVVGILNAPFIEAIFGSINDTDDLNCSIEATTSILSVILAYARGAVAERNIERKLAERCVLENSKALKKQGVALSKYMEFISEYIEMIERTIGGYFEQLALFEFMMASTSDPAGETIKKQFESRKEFDGHKKRTSRKEVIKAIDGLMTEFIPEISTAESSQLIARLRMILKMYPEDAGYAVELLMNKFNIYIAKNNKMFMTYLTCAVIKIAMSFAMNTETVIDVLAIKIAFEKDIWIAFCSNAILDVLIAKEKDLPSTISLDYMKQLQRFCLIFREAMNMELVHDKELRDNLKDYLMKESKLIMITEETGYGPKIRLAPKALLKEGLLDDDELMALLVHDIVRVERSIRMKKKSSGLIDFHMRISSKNKAKNIELEIDRATLKRLKEHNLKPESYISLLDKISDISLSDQMLLDDRTAGFMTISGIIPNISIDERIGQLLKEFWPIAPTPSRNERNLKNNI